MRPYDIKCTQQAAHKLRFDNFQAGDAWILTDGHEVTICAQVLGEKSTQRCSLDRATFNRLIRWYLRDQKVPTP